MDTKASLWTEYRRSFAGYSEKVRELQALTARANPDPDALTAAREVQQARVFYRRRREALAEELMRPEVNHSTMCRSHSAMASSACC